MHHSQHHSASPSKFQQNSAQRTNEFVLSERKGEENLQKDRLVNLPGSHLDVLRPLNLPFEQKSFSFCIPRDRWDKEFFKLQGG
ncbi:hypothetical protein QQP08_026123 [Theobroma cacao]|nr:hypothetical protein QQP08_026123 [Theobroma cacao]